MCVCVYVCVYVCVCVFMYVCLVLLPTQHANATGRRQERYGMQFPVSAPGDQVPDLSLRFNQQSQAAKRLYEKCAGKPRYDEVQRGEPLQGLGVDKCNNDKHNELPFWQQLLVRGK